MRLFPQGNITLGPNESNPVWLTLTATRDRQPTRKTPGEINRATGEAIWLYSSLSIRPIGSCWSRVAVRHRRRCSTYIVDRRPSPRTCARWTACGMAGRARTAGGRRLCRHHHLSRLLDRFPRRRHCRKLPPGLSSGVGARDAFMELPGARDRLALMRLGARRISMITLRRINGPGRFLMLASAFGAKVPDPLPL
jgi:hypothetical protein